MRKTFAGELKALRMKRQATLKVMAKELNLSVSYLNDLERGRRNPSVKNVHAVTQFLLRVHGKVSVRQWHLLAARAHGWAV